MNTGDPNEQSHQKASMSSDVVIPVQIETLVTSKSRKPHFRTKRSKRPLFIGVAVLVVLVVVVAVQLVMPKPIDVVLNGERIHINDETSLSDLLDRDGIDPQPGDYVAVDESVLEKGKGALFAATVNGEERSDESTTFSDGDVVDISDGADIIEEYTEELVTVPAVGTIDGVGAIHEFADQAQDGQISKRTGRVSGKTAEVVVTEAAPTDLRCYNIDSGEDKVIALTFDDGPWAEHTTQILDILRDNDAKATFFTVGDRIAGLEDVVKRAYDEGHQVCTHSWDHAAGTGQGVNLGYMSDQEQLDEITKGYEAIEQATGAEASSVIRVPGGNLDENTARLLSTLATAEIGWNIDTRDWERPGAATILHNIMQAQPGYVILMHDGGGDRSQTVEALREALPALKEQGYSFITIDELLAGYGPAEEGSGAA